MAIWRHVQPRGYPMRRSSRSASGARIPSTAGDEGEDLGFTGQLLNEQLDDNWQVGFGFDDRATPRSCGVIWRAGRDSNPRPSGSKTDPDARSDAHLRRPLCRKRQGAAQGGNGTGSIRLRREAPGPWAHPRPHTGMGPFSRFHRSAKGGPLGGDARTRPQVAGITRMLTDGARRWEGCEGLRYFNSRRTT